MFGETTVNSITHVQEDDKHICIYDFSRKPLILGPHNCLEHWHAVLNFGVHHPVVLVQHCLGCRNKFDVKQHTKILTDTEW